jgi:hypothetical protein
VRSFRSVDQFTIASRGTVYVVPADREMPRADTGLLGATVLLDDREVVVRGVETFMPLRDIAVGERIGLLVDIIVNFAADATRDAETRITLAPSDHHQVKP